MSRTAISIHLDAAEQALLQKILRKLSVPEFQKERVQIVLAAHNGLQNKAIAQQYQLEVNRVGTWRKRWALAQGTQVWRIEVDGDSEGVFRGYGSSDTICFSSETLFVVESERDLV